MKTKVAERGQVTIPKPLRRQLGIRSGTILDFKIENNTLIVIKTEQQDPIQKVYGCLKLNADTDHIMRELRGDDL